MSKELIYGFLAKERCIFLNKDLTRELADEIICYLLYFNNNEQNKEIKFFINTNGGDASALFSIYDVMRFISSPISTICLGKAYSAGAVLLAAGTKGRRFVCKNACVMIHGIQVLFPIQEEGCPKNHLKFLKDYNDKMLSLMAVDTGKDIEVLREDCKRDLYFSAKESIKYGLADGVYKL